MAGSMVMMTGHTKTGWPFYSLPDGPAGRRISFTATEPILIADENGRWLAVLEKGQRVAVDRIEDPVQPAPQPRDHDALCCCRRSPVKGMLHDCRCGCVFKRSLVWIVSELGRVEA